ncbi:hypothetical protein [Antarcticirhabdus aurantiaca]|uniref:hypothetical protein n=1 Tax=Antarcticirhabdus aurantiaca TaxID=2606717 RepID=UPI001AEE8DD9|nr:hypothetical protein [Antarcticirhabdus aurantiaca]
MDLAGFADLPIIRDEAMLRRAWVGYDVAGRMVVYAIAGHEPRHMSEEPIVSIRMGVDFYDAFAEQMKQGPPAPGDMYKRAFAKAEARVQAIRMLDRFEEIMKEMLADPAEEMSDERG